jgi:hypothetical protein
VHSHVASLLDGAKLELKELKTHSSNYNLALSFGFYLISNP